MNVVGGKESLVLIGKSKKFYCFSKLKDVFYFCGVNYFSNDKVWMRIEIMIDIFIKFNIRMKREGRNIFMFFDNVLCYFSTLKGMFLNIRVEFFLKNIISRI